MSASKNVEQEPKKEVTDPATQTKEEALEKTKAAMNNPQPSPESLAQQKKDAAHQPQKK